MRIEDLVFYEFKRYRRNKKPYQRKTGETKNSFEEKVKRIKSIAEKINDKL